MSLTLANCDEQYKKFPQLDKNEVLKLKDWYEKQPHLPNITGINIKQFFHFIFFFNIKYLLKYFFSLDHKYLIKYSLKPFFFSYIFQSKILT